MTFFHHEISNISIYIFCSLILALIIIIASRVVSPDNPDLEKLSAYECGFDPYEDARNNFDVRFYLIALLFLVFDLETVFFLPWSVSISFLSINSFSGMFDFIFELVAGFAYAWIVGALEWE
jgi:NADH-quinone oxidoreductase subunit A|tara:strand:- start:475 stop:840 length:366 start_codon:yes stop_codon:yes gene_type:complete